MAKLTTKKRNKLKDSTFGLVEKTDGKTERKYPMPDKAHAVNAKARASQQVKKGNLSIADKKKIDNKANKVISGKKSDENLIKKKVRNQHV